MRGFRSIVALFAMLAAALPAPALSSSADALHLHVQLVVPQDQLYPGANNGIGLYFTLEPGWHIYWRNAGDSGEPPHIHWTLPQGVTAGPLQFPAPSRLPLGPLMDFGYENEVLFPLQLHVAENVKEGPAVLLAKVDWLVCREVCIPGKADLEVTLHLLSKAPPVASGSSLDSELLKRFANTLPTSLPAGFKAVFQPTKEGFRLGVETGRRESSAVFFPDDQDILDNPSPQKFASTTKGLILELKKDANLTANPAQLNGVLELSGGRAYELSAQPGIVAPASPSFSFTALARVSGLAFLGGLILNLMPCVFPVLFLKGLALVNSGNEEKHKLRTHGFVYTAGILVSFWMLVGAAARPARRRGHARLGIPVPVARFSGAHGRPALLPRPLARRASSKSASPSPAPAVRWPPNRATPAASSPACWRWW